MPHQDGVPSQPGRVRERRPSRGVNYSTKFAARGIPTTSGRAGRAVSLGLEREPFANEEREKSKSASACRVHLDSPFRRA